MEIMFPVCVAAPSQHWIVEKPYLSETGTYVRVRV